MICRAGSIAIAAGAVALSSAASAQPDLAPVWSDGVVVQQGREITVQGYAVAGAQISGTLGGDDATARARGDGMFILRFPARQASADPIALEVRDAEGAARVEDIVVGDVYLCSGQSNMALSVRNAQNGFNNIQASEDPLLRMMTVPQATAPVPQREFGGETAWEKASPATTGDFSAACYYMLRDLRVAHDIPVGAIHSSWGGSQARAWLPVAGGEAIYGREAMTLLADFSDDSLGAVARFASQWEDWYREASGGSAPWAEPGSLDWQPVPAIGPYTAWNAGIPMVSNVWFRRTVELTAEQAASDALLNIGIIDDLDATWVNGNPVGISHGWDTEREYTVPARFLREGANEIVFAASNSWGQGGMQSDADRLSLTAGGERVPLGEGWLYAVSPVTEQPPRTPWDANAGIGVMHNRMIAPIGVFQLAGAAWYQGESDIGLPGYDRRLYELFAGWRGHFGPEMRMLVVQLADYGTPVSEPGESGWADLRDIERLAVEKDPNAALVTAIDLGEWSDIHPTNKVLLGRRLALAARGEALPMPETAQIEGGIVRVRFSGVENGLHTVSGSTLAFELCDGNANGPIDCRFVSGAAQGDSIVLETGAGPAQWVRHAWADAPIVNTFDARNIAVPGFQLGIER